MQRHNVPETLLADVKNQINITWTDEATDQKIRGLIASATVYLDGKGGAAMDYEEDGMPRMLMMEYVRYARDEALDVFENNYRDQILAMQHDKEVERYVEGTGQS